MKPSLVLKLGQQLRMTPQLQQAIKLLQLSTFDLEQEIQEALDSNLMLEEVVADETDDEPTSLDAPDEALEVSEEFMEELRKSADTQKDPADETADSNENSIGSESEMGKSGDLSDPDAAPYDPEIDGDAVPDSHQELLSDKMADDLPVDSVWEDVWDDQPTQSASLSRGEDFDSNYLEVRNTEEITLKDHLLDQISLLHLSMTDLQIAVAIIDGLDNEGVLTIDLEEILSYMDPDTELDEIEAVLHLIQHLDPVGIAARDLKESLLIQINQLPDSTAWKQQGILIISDCLPQLGSRDFNFLIRKTKLKEPELRQVIALIQSLNPRPGSEFIPSKTEYVEPDVIVTRKNDRWLVELNSLSAPRIRVNPDYASMVKRADNSEDNTYLKTHLQEARWFIKSLQQRNETLLKVATKIVEFQKGFLEYGEEAMKPLVLHDVAEAVDLHESTISRVTTQKYMHTPAGVFELKYFFSSHVSSQGGGEVSSTAIRALIKKLVAEENQRKPLSDSKIASLLAEQGIRVARRTIAKYRESLMIPPSNERKQLV
ncbi:MAG: RNA polymerase factor sigma-54 [Gammaproteobacteria bacterium]|nr:RNA polymerase factor sigma-54 [Gammaproteobacteria bacterium]